MLAAGVILAALATAGATPETPAAVVVLKAARLIDGRGGTPLSPAMVRVEGDRIAEVGSRLAIPAGARVIDLGRGHSPARPHRPAHPPHGQVRRSLGAGPRLHDPRPGRVVGRGQRAHDPDGRLHHLSRHGPHLALRRRGPSQRDRGGRRARPPPARGRQLRLLDRGRRRRPPVLDLRGRAHRAQPGRRPGRDHQGRAHAPQERRQFHQDPGHGRRPVQGHTAGIPAVLGRGDPGRGHGGAPLGPAGRRPRARGGRHQGRDPRGRAYDRPWLDARRRGGRDAEGLVVHLLRADALHERRDRYLRPGARVREGTGAPDQGRAVRRVPACPRRRDPHRPRRATPP